MVPSSSLIEERMNQSRFVPHLDVDTEDRLDVYACCGLDAPSVSLFLPRIALLDGLEYVFAQCPTDVINRILFRPGQQGQDTWTAIQRYGPITYTEPWKFRTNVCSGV